jgi:hypothetical protein
MPKLNLFIDDCIQTHISSCLNSSFSLMTCSNSSFSLDDLKECNEHPWKTEDDEENDD